MNRRSPDQVLPIWDFKYIFLAPRTKILSGGNYILSNDGCEFTRQILMNRNELQNVSNKSKFILVATLLSLFSSPAAILADNNQSNNGSAQTAAGQAPPAKKLVQHNRPTPQYPPGYTKMKSPGEMAAAKIPKK